MKLKIILYSLIAVVISSCSSAYKASQTPDDVYYSPTRAIGQENEKKENRDKYEDYVSEEDRYLRMKVRDRQRWSSIDDYDYWYDSRYNPYTYNYYRRGGINVWAWNNWHSPFYHPFYVGGYNPHFNPYWGGFSNVYIIKNPVKTNITRPKLGSYSNQGYNNTNSGSGNTFKKIFSPSNSGGYNNSNNGSYRSSDRTYSPSSGGSSSSGSRSSSGSSSGGGGVSRPGRP
jgi:uncharacterized membrane protein YgcG